MENLQSPVKNYSALISGHRVKGNLLKKNFTFLILLLLTFVSNSQNKAGDISGNYIVPSKDGAIQIYETGGKYYSKIILNKDASKSDLNNPGKEKQKRKILGLTILNSFTFDGEDTWKDGTIYDPKNGKTYSCKITRNENGDLNTRGFIGFSLLGRTEVFTKIKN